MARSRDNQPRCQGGKPPPRSAPRQLSRQDLAQLDPAYLDRLTARQLLALSATLPSDLKAAQERLDQNPSNRRAQSLPIAHAHHHHPERCAGCGRVFRGREPAVAYAAYLVIDLRCPAPEQPSLEVFQDKHVYHERTCACGHVTRAEPAHQSADEHWQVALSERHRGGAMLVALICALSLRMRLSGRRIQAFLADWLGLQLSVATINQCLNEAARAVAPVVEEQLLPDARASTLVHADETSWGQGAELTWLWVFTSATRTRYTIVRRISDDTRNAQGSRTSALLASVIDTCRQRSISPWAFIAETLRQRRKGNPAPLLPAPVV